jgi:signal transduction protein with GAF and PtsI domain
MAEIRDPLGKLLLGEAVRLLVQAGAEGVAIADFICAYSEVLQRNLPERPEPAAPDLKAQIKEALKEALQEIAPPSRRTQAGMRKQVAVYVSGVKTSLSLRKDLVAKIEEATGGSKPARRLIHEFANSHPPGHSNRSAWVEEQLHKHLMLARVETKLELAH